MANVIKNGSFDEGFRHWQSVGNWTISQDGIATLGLTSTSASLSQSAIEVIPGQSYSFQYSARHQGLSGLSMTIRLADALSGNSIHQEVVTVLDNEFQTISGVFRVPEGVSTAQLVFEIHYLGDETNEELYLDNLVIFHYQICFGSRSMVLVQWTDFDDQVREEEIPVSELNPSIHRVFRTDTREFIPLEMVVQAGMTNTFFNLRQGLLGPDEPNRDLFITSGHRIIYQGSETKVREIPGRKRVKLSSPDQIFTLVCQDHCPIMVNGIGVVAYGLEEWQISRLSMITSNLIEFRRRRD